MRVPVHDGEGGDADGGGGGKRWVTTWDRTPGCEEDVRVVREELGEGELDRGPVG
jgi:hypothetical protein